MSSIRLNFHLYYVDLIIDFSYKVHCKSYTLWCNRFDIASSSGVRVGHGWATAQGAGYKGALRRPPLSLLTH